MLRAAETVSEISRLPVPLIVKISARFDGADIIALGHKI